jgi:hypothetical protein
MAWLRDSYLSGTRLRAVVSDSSMGRRAVVGISVIAVLALVVATPLARRFHLSVLRPSELAAKRLAPPAPPDDGCAQIQRALAGSAHKKPAKNTNPFSTDEVAIYRGILERWNSNSRGLLNVSNRTFPFDRNISDCGCLKRHRAADHFECCSLVPRPDERCPSRKKHHAGRCG